MQEVTKLRGLQERRYDKNSGVHRKGVQKRSCLRCDSMFLSSGPENRLCEACKSENHKKSIPEDDFTLWLP
jgi:hypothetical protein